jgi:tight adherence protein C
VQFQMTATLALVFVSVALLAGIAAWSLLTGPSEGRRRLSELSRPAKKKKTGTSPVIVEETPLAAVPDPEWNSLLEMLPTSRGTVRRLRREMALAGYGTARAAALLSLSELVLPVLLALPPFFLLPGPNRWIAAVAGAVTGYMAPGFFLSRRIKRRKTQIENGLADALDLMVLCLEAGSSLDQAIVKTGEELDVAYPALGDQLNILISEMRAGKPRLEAFRGFADRTQVDDVRALVSMLIQTDRFGTSISQALRTQAIVSRTKRRQRAEERAQKVGVKLVFPLVFCLFPALYVVMLGPAYLQFMKVFAEGQ